MGLLLIPGTYPLPGQATDLGACFEIRKGHTDMEIASPSGKHQLCTGFSRLNPLLWARRELPARSILPWRSFRAYASGPIARLRTKLKVFWKRPTVVRTTAPTTTA